MRKRARIAAAGLAVGLLAGGSGVAVAATSGSPAAAKRSCGVAKDKSVVGLDASPVAVKAALRDAKAASTPQDGLLAPAAVAVFARDLHISTAKAQAVLSPVRLKKIVAVQKMMVFPKQALHDFAVRLGVGDERAKQVLGDIGTVAKPGDANFAAVARSLGKTPQQLSAALVQLKRELITCHP